MPVVSLTTMATMEAAQLTDKLRQTVMPVTILFVCEIVIGIIGNSLTIFVFLFRYKACNFRYFVIGLAVTDLIACLTTIPGEIVSQLFWYTYPVPPVCKIKAYFNQWTVVCEAAFLTLIALDRYRKICRPVKWQIERKGAIYSCCCVFLGATLLMIQTPIFWGVHTEDYYKDIDDKELNVTVCEKDYKFVDTPLPKANVIFVGTLDLIAVLCMFAMYIRVAQKIFSEQRYEKSIVIQKAKRKALMGFILTVIFVLTTVLYWPLIILVAGGILSELEGVKKVFFFFFLRLYFINHIINPILYGIMDPQFRKQMCSIRYR